MRLKVETKMCYARKCNKKSRRVIDNRKKDDWYCEDHINSPKLKETTKFIRRK